MKSSMHGTNTSVTEVLNISRHGFWILVNEKEYFLSYSDFPWFKDAKVNDILNVTLLHDKHLHWETLDIDLDLSSLQNPEKYPLVYKD